MNSSQVGEFERKHNGRSGRSCFCVHFGDYYSVADLQRRGADLLSLQPGDPQAGTSSVYSQPDVLQPVAKRV